MVIHAMSTCNLDIFCFAAADRALEDTPHRTRMIPSKPATTRYGPVIDLNRIDVIGPINMAAAGEASAGRSDRDCSRSANRAFILEDNESSAFLMKSYLEIHGYQEIVRSKNLKEFSTHKKSIIEGYYDIVILDVMLPDGESLQELKELKQEHVFPVCVYTARTSAADKAAYQRLGCDAIIEKPASLDRFRRIHARLKDQEA